MPTPAWCVLWNREKDRILNTVDEVPLTLIPDSRSAQRVVRINSFATQTPGGTITCVGASLPTFIVDNTVI